MDVILRDYEQDDFIIYPPNIFTPNGDGFNPYFAMEMIDPMNNDIIHVMPADNCKGKFEGIKIFNRWGKEVYSSNDRYFKWYGSNEAPGVYFYRIAYTHKEYKGTVTLRD